jgi:hypothetical protein
MLWDSTTESGKFSTPEIQTGAALDMKDVTPEASPITWPKNLGVQPSVMSCKSLPSRQKGDRFP